MGDYIERTITRLKREYSKDELVSSMIEAQRKIELELGIIKSERDELKYELNKILKLTSYEKSKLGEKKVNLNMKSEIKSLREKCRKLKISNEELLCKLASKNKCLCKTTISNSVNN